MRLKNMKKRRNKLQVYAMCTTVGMTIGLSALVLVCQQMVGLGALFQPLLGLSLLISLAMGFMVAHKDTLFSRANALSRVDHNRVMTSPSASLAACTLGSSHALQMNTSNTRSKSEDYQMDGECEHYQVTPA